MTNDTAWVEDVKRWYLAGVGSATRDGDSSAGSYGSEVGYEAAQPALEARHWPDAVAITTDR